MSVQSSSTVLVGVRLTDLFRATGCEADVCGPNGYMGDVRHIADDPVEKATGLRVVSGRFGDTDSVNVVGVVVAETALVAEDDIPPVVPAEWAKIAKAQAKAAKGLARVGYHAPPEVFLVHLYG